MIVDYGQMVKAVTAFRRLPIINRLMFFTNLGNTDLSHWVDFSAIRRAAEESGARLVGPVTQGNFLRKIGIMERSAAAAKLADARNSPWVICSG